MIVTNKETGKDVTGLVIKRMEGKLTKKEFEELTGFSKEKELDQQADMELEMNRDKADLKSSKLKGSL